MFGCFDSEPDAISANLQDGDFDVVGHYDFLILLTTDYKHSALPLKKVPSNPKERYRMQKIHSVLILVRFVGFNFPNFSGKLLTFSK